MGLYPSTPLQYSATACNFLSSAHRSNVYNFKSGHTHSHARTTAQLREHRLCWYEVLLLLWNWGPSSSTHGPFLGFGALTSQQIINVAKFNILTAANLIILKNVTKFCTNKELFTRLIYLILKFIFWLFFYFLGESPPPQLALCHQQLPTPTTKNNHFKRMG